MTRAKYDSIEEANKHKGNRTQNGNRSGSQIAELSTEYRKELEGYKKFATARRNRRKYTQEFTAVAPSKVEKHNEKHEPVTWWCGRCGKGYGDSIPKGECPKCKDIEVIKCECGFEYYATDINGKPSTCPECEMREWEAKQEHKTEPQAVEPQEEPEQIEEPQMDDYDMAIANGDYCEAREHYNDNDKHKIDTGCKYEEKHPEECESEEE